MERGRRSRPPVPLVYETSFGSHRCGSVIRLGRGCRQSSGHSSGQRPRAAPEPQDEPSPGPGRCRAGRPGSRAPDHLQEAEAKAHTFDFPIPSRSVDKVIKRKKKKSKVWHKVWKVISKMLEENKRFRSRLLACSQFGGEEKGEQGTRKKEEKSSTGSGVNQTSQNGAYLDREESIFGWV